MCCALPIAALPCGATNTTGIVAVEGSSNASLRARIVWSPAGGDIRSIFPGGAYEEIWFSKGRVVWRGVAGDTRTTNWDGAYQLARLLLTKQYVNLRVAQASVLAGERMERRILPNVGSLSIASKSQDNIEAASSETMIFRNIVFDADIAVSWTAQSEYGLPSLPDMRSGKQVQAPTRFPDAPTTVWNRAATLDKIISASIGGRAASLIVDSGSSGLSISRKFSSEIGVEPDAGGAVFKTCQLLASAWRKFSHGYQMTIDTTYMLEFRYSRIRL
jgi:hypothetical protein